MKPTLERTLDAIVPPVDPQLEERVRARLDSLTKPRGSLGRLEELALWYALARGSEMPEEPRPALYVFCADHGVVEEGVSAYPREVTRQMALNFAAGGAAINVLSRQRGFEARVVDMGIAGELPADVPVTYSKIVSGTRNMLVEPAMSLEQAREAVEAGIGFADSAADSGATLLLGGEMGIGNTTAAAALTAAFTGAAPAAVVGRGAGLDDAGLHRKAKVVRSALEARQPNPKEPLAALAEVGGFEIAALTGFYLGAAARRTPALVDGFIASAAALVAVRLAPEARGYLAFAHMSAERGHRLLLDALDARPLLDLEMRLGEGSAAALASDLVVCAVRLYREMATFASARVSDQAAAAR